MGNFHFAVRASVLSLSLLLTGCGDSGGGTVASTPTPTPTPTLTPVAGNADLSTLTVDESFTNDLASLSLTKASGANASLGNGTIALARAQLAYTLTVGANSQTFVPTNIDQTLRQNDTNVYLKTTGSVLDRMEMNFAGSLPTWSFRYVGGAIWTHGDSGTDLNSYAFSYGAETADSSVPRSGSAKFDVRLMGRGFWAQDLTHLTGNGTITVNFGSGSLNGSGLALEQSSSNRKAVASGDWSMNGTISSAANAFTGTFALYPASGTSPTGSLAGRFYGPAATELGASFAVNGNSPLGTGSLIGVILGEKQDPSLRNATLASPTANFTTADFHYGIRSSITQSINVDSTTGKIDTNYLAAATPITPTSIEYRASDGAYILKRMDLSVVPNTLQTVFTTGPAPDLATSDSRFASYVLTTGNVSERVRLYRPAGSNGDVALTYSSLINYRRSEPSATAGKTQISNTWLAYGMLSDHSSFPATGTANYAGKLYGSAVDGVAGSKPYDVEGTNQFAINFANDTFSGSFSPVLVAGDGTRTNLGTWALANTQLQIRDTSFPGLNASLTTNLGPNGEVSGLFFGPTASELVGTFSTRWATSGGSGDMTGGFVSIKQ